MHVAIVNGLRRNAAATAHGGHCDVLRLDVWSDVDTDTPEAAIWINECAETTSASM